MGLRSEFFGTETQGKRNLADRFFDETDTGKKTYKPGDLVSGYRIAAGFSDHDIHYGTHLEPGVYDIGEREVKKQKKTLEQAAEELRELGFIVAVRKKGQRNIKSNHLHFADPEIAPKETQRLVKQGWRPGPASMASHEVGKDKLEDVFARSAVSHKVNDPKDREIFDKAKKQAGRKKLESDLIKSKPVTLGMAGEPVKPILQKETSEDDPLYTYVENLAQSGIDLAAGFASMATKPAATLLSWLGTGEVSPQDIDRMIASFQDRFGKDAAVGHAFSPYTSVSQPVQETKDLAARTSRVLMTAAEFAAKAMPQTRGAFDLAEQIRPEALQRVIDDNPEWFDSVIPEWEAAVGSGRLFDIVGDVAIAAGAIHGGRRLPQYGRRLSDAVTGKTVREVPGMGKVTVDRKGRMRGFETEAVPEIPDDIPVRPKAETAAEREFPRENLAKAALEQDTVPTEKLETADVEGGRPIRGERYVFEGDDRHVYQVISPESRSGNVYVLDEHSGTKIPMPFEQWQEGKPKLYKPPTAEETRAIQNRPMNIRSGVLKAIREGAETVEDVATRVREKIPDAKDAEIREYVDLAANAYGLKLPVKTPQEPISEPGGIGSRKSPETQDVAEAGQERGVISEKAESVKPAPAKAAPGGEHPAVAAVLSSKDGITIEEITRGTGIPSSEVLSNLTIAELSGKVKRLPGNKFAKGDARVETAAPERTLNEELFHAQNRLDSVKREMDQLDSAMSAAAEKSGKFPDEILERWNKLNEEREDLEARVKIFQDDVVQEDMVAIGDQERAEMLRPLMEYSISDQAQGRYKVARVRNGRKSVSKMRWGLRELDGLAAETGMKESELRALIEEHLGNSEESIFDIQANRPYRRVGEIGSTDSITSYELRKLQAALRPFYESSRKKEAPKPKAEPEQAPTPSRIPEPDERTIDAYSAYLNRYGDLVESGEITAVVRQGEGYLALGPDGDAIAKILGTPRLDDGTTFISPADLELVKARIVADGRRLAVLDPTKAEAAPAGADLSTAEPGVVSREIRSAGDFRKAWLETGRFSDDEAAAYTAIAEANRGYLGMSEAEYYKSLWSDITSEGTPSEAALRQGFAPAFYSKLQQVIEQKMGGKMDAGDLRRMLEKSGVKTEEMKWTGLDKWLESQDGTVTKQDALDFVVENQIKVKEVEKGGNRPPLEWTQQGNRVQAEGGYSIERLPNGRFLARHRGSGLQEGFATFQEAQRHVEEWRSRSRENQIPTQYKQYTLPGGENYRELLFTLPGRERRVVSEDRFRVHFYEGPEQRMEYATQPQIDAARRQGIPVEVLGPVEYTDTSGNFQSSHWDEPNVLAHVRFNDRVDASGRKVLHIEEVQSDWHQAGRERGYKGEMPDYLEVIEDDGSFVPDQRRFKVRHKVSGEDVAAGPTREAAVANFESTQKRVPDAPFSKSWPEFVMKRMIRHAAENGYDAITWTTGEIQAARYDLAKQVKHIAWELNEDGTYNISAPLPDNDSGGIYRENLSIQEVKDLVGKDITDKIIAGEGTKNTTPLYENWKILDGEDLKVGGEGMQGFYDSILPNTVNKLAKKWGAKVEETSISLTPEMKNAVLYEGQPLFQEQYDIDAVARRKRLPQYLPHEDTYSRIRVQWSEEGKRWEVTDTVLHEVLASGTDRRQTLRDAAAALKDRGEDVLWSPDQAALWQPNQGSVEFTEAGQAVIRAFGSADASTGIHEMSHVFRRNLLPEDLAVVEDAYGIKDGSWTRGHEERFARGFERYLREGKAPTEGLRRVFEQFKEWLSTIYQTIKGTPLADEIPADVRTVYDRMLGGKTEAPSRKGRMRGASAAIDGARERTPRSGTHTDIGSLYDDATAGTSGKSIWMDYAPVTDEGSARIKHETGHDVSGYTHTIDGDFIRHAISGHGPEGEFRGQHLPITREDILRIPEIVETADSIKRVEKTPAGNEIIQYRKRVNGVIFYLEEMRKGRRKLGAKTMWKVESGGGSKPTDVVHTSETHPSLKRALPVDGQGDYTTSGENLKQSSSPEFIRSGADIGRIERWEGDEAVVRLAGDPESTYVVKNPKPATQADIEGLLGKRLPEEHRRTLAAWLEESRGETPKISRENSPRPSGIDGAVSAPPGSTAPRQISALPPDRKAGPVSERDVIVEMVNVTGQKHRQGRMRGVSGSFAAIFKRGKGVSRARNMYSVEDAAHEIGHGLGESLKWNDDPRFDSELMRFGDPADLGPKSSWQNGKPDDVRRREGIAEYVRIYVQDPDIAYQNAPQFTKAFEKALSDAGMQQGFSNAQNLWKKFISQEPFEKLEAYTDYSGEVADLSKPKERHGFITDYVDDLFRVRQLVEETHGKRYEEVKPTENPYELMRLSRGSHGVADQLLIEGNERTKGLAEIFDMARDTSEGRKDFERYARARRMKAYQEAERPTGAFTEAEIDEVLRRFDDPLSKHYNPNFRKAFDEYQKWNDELLRIEENFYTPEALKAWKEIPDYVPMHRVLEAGIGEGRENFPASASREFANQQVRYNRYTGKSEAKYRPWFEVAVERAYNSTQKAMQNDAMLALVDMIEGSPDGGRILERIPNDLIPHNVLGELKAVIDGANKATKSIEEMQNLAEAIDQLPEDLWDLRYWQQMKHLTNGQKVDRVVMVMRKGKPEFYQVGDEILYEAIVGAKKKDLGPMMKMMAAHAGALRTGVTLDPGFLFYSNLIRDSFHAYVVSEGGFVPVWDTVGNMKQAAAGGELKKRLTEAGGAMSGTAALDRGSVRRKVKNLADGDSAPQKVVESLRNVRDASEMTNRLAVYKREMKAAKRKHPDWSERDVQLYAAFRSRDMLDFAMKGRKAAEATRVIAFARSKINGLAKLTHEIQRDPVRIAAHMAPIVMGTAMLYDLNHENPAYWELSEWERNNYWHVPIPGGREFIRIPKPHEWGFVGGTLVEDSLRLLKDRDPHAFDSAIGAAYSVGSMDWPNMMQLVMDLAGNRQSFSGAPIVPEYLTHGSSAVRPEDQVKGSTSPIFRRAGESLGVSGAKLEYAAKQLGGPSADYATTIVDWMTVPLTGEKPLKSANPLRRVTTHQNSYPAMYDELRRQYEQVRENYNSAKLSKTSAGRDGKAKKYGYADFADLSRKRSTLESGWKRMRTLQDLYYESENRADRYKVRDEIQRKAQEVLNEAGLNFKTPLPEEE